MEVYSNLLERLPCDLVFPIFVAANTFLHFWNDSGDQGTHSRQRLNQCSRWLVELGKSWKNAEARNQVLSNCELPQPSPRHAVGTQYWSSNIALSTNNATFQTEPARINSGSGQEEMQISKLHTAADPFMPLLQENFDLEYTDWIAMLDNGKFGDLVWVILILQVVSSTWSAITNKSRLQHNCFSATTSRVRSRKAAFLLVIFM